MRVPNVTTSENILDVIRKMDRRQLQLQQQISDGQKITLPEDDGMKMGRLIRMETEKSSLVQYQRNSSYADEYLTSSHLNLDKLRELGVRSQELARTSGSGINYAAMATNSQEVNQLLEEAYNRINSTHRKKALFGGTITSPEFGSTEVQHGQRYEKKLSFADNYVPENLTSGDKFTLNVAGGESYVVDTSVDLDPSTDEAVLTASSVAALLRDRINAETRKSGISSKLDVENNLIIFGPADEDFEVSATYETESNPNYDYPNDTKSHGDVWVKDLTIGSSKVPEATTISLSHPNNWQRLTSYDRGELAYYKDKIWESQIDGNFNHFPDSNLSEAWRELDSSYDAEREDWNLSVTDAENRQFYRAPDGWLYETLEEAQQHVLDVLNEKADVDTPEETLNSMYAGIDQVTMSIAQFEAAGSESAAARVSFDPRTLEYRLTASANGENVEGSRLIGNLRHELGASGKTTVHYEQSEVFVYNGHHYKALEAITKGTSLADLPTTVGDSNGKALYLGTQLPSSGHELALDAKSNQQLIKGEYLHDLSSNEFFLVLENFSTGGKADVPFNLSEHLNPSDPEDPTTIPKLERIEPHESVQGADWDQARIYNYKDIVYYNNRYWECLKDNYNNTAYDATVSSPTFTENYIVYPDDEFMHNEEGSVVNNEVWLPIGESFGHVAKFRVDRTDWPQVMIAPPTRGGEGAEAEAVVDASGRLVGVRLTKAGNYNEDGLDMPTSAIVRTADGKEVTVEVLGDNGNIFGFKLLDDVDYDLNFPSSANLDDTFSFATGKHTFLAHRNQQGEIISVAYNGNEKNAEAYVGRDSKISSFLDASNGGTKELGDMADAMIDLRDALRDAKPSSYVTEVEAANQKLIALEDKVVDKMGEIASKMARIETVRNHDEEYYMDLDKRIAKDIDVDLSEAIVRMTQATTAYQASIQVGAHIMNTSLLNYL